MTSDAREVTAGVKPNDVVLGAIVRSVVEAAAHAGFERESFIARLGLSPADLEDPDGLVAFDAYVTAWETVAATPGCERFGLELGALSTPRFLGALGYAMIHATDALEAIRMFHRYRRLVSDTLAPEIEIDERYVTYRLVWPPRIARIVQFADSAFMGTLSLLRELAGLPKDVPLAAGAWFQCSRPDGEDRALVLGCPVHFDAPETRFVLLREPLERPLPRHDPALFRYLEKHATAVLDRLQKEDSVGNRVRCLLTEALGSGEPSQAEVGKRLGMSERTLQRRLRSEGITFAEILDGLRRELSVRYLSEPGVAVYEVAFLLGYSEPSAFHRAFRRWTGQTPKEYRQREAPP